MALLSDAQVEDRLRRLTGWGRAGNVIERTYRFPTFPDAITFVTQLAGVAERMNHHPDIVIRYNRVTLTLSTHSEGGLTTKDFELAEALDALA